MTARLASTAPVHRRPASCVCPDMDRLTCAECDGEVLVAAAPRRELLRDAVVEAARHLIARIMVEERQRGRLDVDMPTADAIEDLVEALRAERASRPERGTT